MNLNLSGEARPSSFDFYKFNFRLGPREIVRAVDYFRYFEHSLVAERLALTSGMKVLDLGSGTGLFPLYLANRLGCRVVASDIAEACLAWQESAAKRIDQPHGPGENYEIRSIDSRNIPYPENTFDRVLNLGSIEHIREDGDTDTIQEMARVARPGGRVVLSIPYGSTYEEEETPSHYCAFERRYDEAALRARLIEPSGLRVMARDYFGEPTVRFSRMWYPLPFVVKLPFRHLAPVFSNLFLRRLPESQRDKACGICLTLTKPPD